MSRLDEALIRRLEGEYFQRYRGVITREQQSLTDRVRRSLTWLRKSLTVSVKDTPPRFVDLWIALNCLYGVRPYPRRAKESTEEKDFVKFLHRLKGQDNGPRELSSMMRDNQVVELAPGLVENKYLWNEFWTSHFSAYTEKWQQMREDLKRAFEKDDPVTFLTCVFKRLYVLRNQIFHGSSSSTTRRSEDALIPGIAILEILLPRLIHFMIQHGSGKGWPLIPYPGIDTEQHPKESHTDSFRM